jgi:hypothetical protein
MESQDVLHDIEGIEQLSMFDYLQAPIRIPIASSVFDTLSEEDKQYCECVAVAMNILEQPDFQNSVTRSASVELPKFLNHIKTATKNHLSDLDAPSEQSAQDMYNHVVKFLHRVADAVSTRKVD